MKAMMQDPLTILILCTGNSARSIMGEAILNRVGQGRFRAFSAGSQPKGEPHPLALNLLAREGIDTAFARSKSWDEFAGPDAPALDLVITVCDSAAGETCPYWPGAPITAHWGIPDPAAATGTEAERALAFATAYAQLTRRALALAALPLATLDRAAQTAAIRAIGRLPE